MTDPTIRRRKKHFKSRAGCFACKERKIKCDEHKPICHGCLKRSRECIYPLSAEKNDESFSENILGGVNDDKTQKVVRKFSARDSSATTSSVELFQPYQRILIDSSRTSIDITESRYTPPSSILPFSIRASHFYERLESSANVLSTRMIQIPTIPKSIRHDFIQFFITFHQANINEFHYFCYHDYHRFFTTTLMIMIERPNALRDAVVAFSALIYSTKVDRSAKALAFLYYTSAVQQLRVLLDQITMNIDECHMAIATALQLASFDRFLNDPVKCFRHLKGAAWIMLRFSDPVRLCSTAVGRFFLDWYCNFEGYCCMRAAYPTLLPIEWRQESERIRQKLAIKEYSYLTRKDHKAQLLDISWAQLSCLTPRLIDILAAITQLKLMKCQRRKEMAIHLQSEFQQFYRDFAEYINSSLVMEVLQPLLSLNMTTSKHVDCCPPPPFTPHFFQYPPAGLLHLVIQSLKISMRFSLYPSLRAELEFELEVADLQDATFYSFEVCRTFAGIERQFDHNDAIMYPCIVPMVMAALNCLPNIRPWMLAKLRHFDELGIIFSDSVKMGLAMLWNVPEIATKGFSLSLSDNSSNVPVVADVVDITVDLEKVNLNPEAENVEDDGLEAITQLRGVFGLQDK